MDERIVQHPQVAPAEHTGAQSSVGREDLRGLGVKSISRIRVNTRMIWMLTAMAEWLFSALESMATPCSVNTSGSFLRPPQLDVAFYDFKIFHSSWSNSNMKSSGNRLMSRFACSFSLLVSTW